MSALCNKRYLFNILTYTCHTVSIFKTQSYIVDLKGSLLCYIHVNTVSRSTTFKDILTGKLNDFQVTIMFWYLKDFQRVFY